MTFAPPVGAPGYTPRNGEVVARVGTEDLCDEELASRASARHADTVVRLGGHRAGHVDTVTGRVFGLPVVVPEVPLCGYLAPEVRVADGGTGVDDGYPYTPAKGPAPSAFETGCDQTPLLANFGSLDA